MNCWEDLCRAPLVWAQGGFLKVHTFINPVFLFKIILFQSSMPRAFGRGQTTESAILEKFSLTYQRERHFSQNVNHAIFVKIFASLVKSRLSASEWIEKASPESILRVIMCLRIFMRDAEYQNSFAELGGIRILAKYLQKATDSYLTYGDAPLVVDILKEMTNIFQKLSANISHRESVVKHGVHKALVLLLSANDVIVLHCTLHALISLAQSPEPCKLIAELNLIETLLHILQEYDTLSKRLAAELLRLLCADSQAQEMIKVFDGIPLLLSLLHSDNLKLLWNAVWCLVQLSGDRETSDDIRTMGGLPLLLSLLHDRKFISDRATASGLSGPRTPDELDEMRELQLSLPSACCACLTELVLNDANAQQIVQRNGLYSLGLLIMPRDTSSWQRRETAAFRNLQANAFRTLRFLFSMERNRRHFKRLFPPELFEMFIDIGHYKKEISAYKSLVEKINSLDRDALSEILENLEVSNQNKEPTKRIGDYSVLELLGSGAFGSVYKVKKETAGQTYFALKEINTLNPSWGQSSKEIQTSVGAFMSELSIIREQLRHPNVVRYYKTFVEQEKLYIVMELIEGAPIGDHFKSLEEKKARFTEDQIWNIFIQLVLALRYLHKEKSIIHRDLTPNNIMLGENDKVTISKS
ncbi:hypothetical protein CAPTEDRAFT_200137 [Capitella teleta]|uniref:Protein kinase domain-containing protein n=1 Tax=Capitella teleta TaxID=283909 RepID=R7VBK0_CAPTE|nr:hypothetical protein CAPTEDRAFT_200137 [Capitella teleta]|eukprot:ELU13080.1 hypothetical protein CAPTEDRAFT_200137 [Capitella teleta]